MKTELFKKLMNISDEELIRLTDRIEIKRNKFCADSLSRLFSCVKNEIYARWVAEKESISFRETRTVIDKTT